MIFNDEILGQMEKIVGYLNRSHSTTIIETGCGYSTLVWDHMAETKGFVVYALEKDDKTVRACLKNTQCVNYMTGETVLSLNNLNPMIVSQCGLLFLDGMGLADNAEDAIPHVMQELCAVWRDLPSGCMIAVPGCLTKVGRHQHIKQFFDRIAVKPYFEGYITAWIKP